MDIGLRSLRIFLKVIESGSFSSAARGLQLTQPTISQQMARLEEEMGGRLFERVGHDIHITDLGRTLHTYALEVVERTTKLSEDLSNARTQHAGLVRYAIPESCQWTPHFRSIMGDIRDLPDVTFEIGILPSHEIVKLLMEGRIDFGFAVGERLQSELRFEHFSDEAYSAVAADAELLAPLKQGDFNRVRWISYPGWELFFDTWAKGLGLPKQVRAGIVQSRVKIGTLAGAIHVAEEGAGVAVIPTHCLAAQLEKGSLLEFQSSKKRPTNPVHLVTRRGERLPARVLAVLELLKEAKRLVG